MKGLLIRDPWIDRILSGKKTWELRGQRTKVRGRIVLIRAGSGHVVGTAELVDVIGPLSLSELKRTERKHRVEPRHFSRAWRYRKTYAWRLANPRRYKRAKPYDHPAGAVIWVNL